MKNKLTINFIAMFLISVFSIQAPPEYRAESVESEPVKNASRNKTSEAERESISQSKAASKKSATNQFKKQNSVDSENSTSKNNNNVDDGHKGGISFGAKPTSEKIVNADGSTTETMHNDDDSVYQITKNIDGSTEEVTMHPDDSSIETTTKGREKVQLTKNSKGEILKKVTTKTNTDGSRERLLVNADGSTEQAIKNSEGKTLKKVTTTSDDNKTIIKTTYGKKDTIADDGDIKSLTETVYHADGTTVAEKKYRNGSNYIVSKIPGGPKTEMATDEHGSTHMTVTDEKGNEEKSFHYADGADADMIGVDGKPVQSKDYRPTAEDSKNLNDSKLTPQSVLAAKNILNINTDPNELTSKEVKVAFAKKSRETHSDKTGKVGNDNSFTQVTQAKDLLLKRISPTTLTNE